MEIPHENTTQSVVPNPQVQDVLRTRASPKGKECAGWRRRIEDPHHPRGYRELRSPAEMRKLLNRKIVEQDKICAICHFEFTDYNDAVLDHENPKGMGGAWRDDHPSNVRAVHWWCNSEKGINEDGRVTADPMRGLATCNKVDRSITCREQNPHGRTWQRN